MPCTCMYRHSHCTPHAFTVISHYDWVIMAIEANKESAMNILQANLFRNLKSTWKRILNLAIFGVFTVPITVTSIHFIGNTYICFSWSTTPWHMSSPVVSSFTRTNSWTVVQLILPSSLSLFSFFIWIMPLKRSYLPVMDGHVFLHHSHRANVTTTMKNHNHCYSPKLVLLDSVNNYITIVLMDLTWQTLIHESSLNLRKPANPSKQKVSALTSARLASSEPNLYTTTQQVFHGNRLLVGYLVSLAPSSTCTTMGWIVVSSTVAILWTHDIALIASSKGANLLAVSTMLWFCQ